MNRSRKSALALAVAAAIIATAPIYLTACGGGGGNGAVRPSSPTLPPSPPPPPAPPPPPPPSPSANIWAPISAGAPGGNGTWSTNSPTWTNTDGDGPVPMSPQPSLAIFQGTAGTVTVDASAGEVSVTGMQFSVDGYTLTGAALELTGSAPSVDVGDGTSASAGDKAIIENVLTGSAGLVKGDYGTLVLTGNNTYSGGTTINTGTLQIGNGGTSGSIVGDVADFGSLVFNRGDAVTYGGVVSGTGSLMQAGAGTLTLTGTNTYTGDTDIEGGTLALVDDGSIADSNSIKIGGTLDISGTTNGATIKSFWGNGSIVLGGEYLVVSGAPLFRGVISGSGGLTVSSGYTILAGVNTYTGLTTIDQDAQLHLGAIGETGSVAGDILDNGLLSFDGPDLMYGGVISGTGNVEKFGTGTLTLTGINTFTGGLMVTGVDGDSVLAVSSDANLGAPGVDVELQGGTLEATASFTLDRGLSLVSNPARGPDAVQVDSGATLTVAKGIAGGSSDSLIKTGPGSLVLASTAGYGGTTTISEGTLALTDFGSLSASSEVSVDGTFDISGTTSGASIQSLSGTGAVTLGAQTLTLSNASGDFSGVISGSGGLTLSGGTQSLSGTNTYGGGTNIYGGVLQVSSDANLGDVDGEILIDNGTLRAGGSFTSLHTIAIQDAAHIDTNGHELVADGLFGTIVGIDPGHSTLIKDGAGTLTITTRGDPDYGPTIINAGTLAAPSIAMPGPLTVASGATFDISGLPGSVVNASVPALGGDGTVALGDNILDLLGADVSWTFGGVIADGGIAGGTGGGLNFYGSNTTATLTGVNTYTGTTTIENGTLALVGNGSIADSTIVVVGDAGNNGTLDISGTTNGATIKSLSGGVTESSMVVLGGKTLTVSEAANDFAGVISGTGSLVVAGGMLTLDRDNTYTGGTTIAAGAILQLGYNGANSGSIVGDVMDNGALIFNHSSDFTFAGIISGTGSLTKDGPGVLTLTGLNTYSGGTTVNGWLRATQPLPADVAVSNFGTLDGALRVDGDLSNAGRVAVHGGDTTVGGNYIQISGGVDHGTLAVSLGSKLAVSGTATLNGGTLEVTGADTGYVANTHTDVLTAAGGVSGTFGQLVKDSGVVFISNTIQYGANEVWLDTTGLSITAAAASMGFADPASVGAARRVQTGFEAINSTMASGGTVPAAVLQGAGAIQHSATPVIAHTTLKSLSGQLHAASAAMLFDGIDASGNALSEHFDDLLSGRVQPGVWYVDLGWQGNLERGGYAGTSFRSSGVMAGADLRIGSHALLGFAAGQSRGFGQLNAAWDHNRTWMNNIAMYGGLTNGPWFAGTQVASGSYREDMQRLLQLGALASSVGTDSTGRYVVGALEGGRMFQVAAIRVVPYADVRYQRLELGGFTEQGGLGYGLKADARSAGRLQAGLGLRAEGGWRLANGMRLAWDGSAGWRHTLHQYGGVFNASFTGFDDWLPVEGVGLSRNTKTLRAGVSLWPTRNFGLRLGYMREQGQRERAGSAMLQGTVTF